MPYGPGKLVGWRRIPPARLNFIGQSPGANKLPSAHNRVVVIRWDDIGSNFAVGFNNIPIWQNAFFADQRKFYFQVRNPTPHPRILPNVNVLIQNGAFNHCATFDDSIGQYDGFAYDCTWF